MKHRWLFLVLLPVLLGAVLISGGLASAYTLARLTSPGLVLAETGGEGRRFGITPPGPLPARVQPALAARIEGSVWFGHRQRIALPDGGQVRCTYRAIWAFCTKGWRIEEAAD